MAEGTAQYDYEVAVVGAGPGGYVAAIKAAQMGMRTCVIEREHLGGTCLNVGCIPTKTLIKTASMLRELREAAAFAIEGVPPGGLRVSMPRLQERKTAVGAPLVGGVRGLLRGNKVEAISAEARFLDPHTLQAGGRRVSAGSIIVATGSKAVVPPFIPVEGKSTVLTSTEALSLDHVPERAVIIGGGVIGVEFAYLLNLLGSRVTVLELLDRILPMVDGEVSALAQKRMEKDGIAFRLGARVLGVRDNRVRYEHGGQEQEARADAVLMAVGRAPNTDGLGAEGIGLQTERGALRADGAMRTSIAHIYAVGDVNGRSMLAHTASHEGLAAVSAITGGHEAVDYDRIPSCVYTDPEIASVGLTEEEARKRHGRVRVGRFPAAANGKSLVEGDPDGLFKVIIDEAYGEILGAHLYGKHATDMVGEIAVAMAGEVTAEELARAVHPHPTVSEALPEAFMAAMGRAIHAL
jgi:dihydrolipoamide dehydrogenase